MLKSPVGGGEPRGTRARVTNLINLHDERIIHTSFLLLTPLFLRRCAGGRGNEYRHIQHRHGL